MAKKNTPQPQKEMTRRRMASWQKQKRRQRLILIGGIGLITVAVLLILVGWLVADAIPRGKTALSVDGVKYSAGDCVNAILAYYNPTVDQVDQTAPQIISTLQQLEIIAQESEALGVEVSGADVDAMLDASGLGKQYRRFVELDLIQQSVGEYFIDQVPATAPQRQIYAMLLEDQDQALAARQQLLDGEDFTTLAKLVAINTFSKDNGGDLDWHQRKYFDLSNPLDSDVPLDWAWQAAEGDLSPVLADSDVQKPGGYWIWMVSERNDDQGSHVYGLQLPNLPEAQDAYARLQAGEDFATLAEEFSQYTQSPEGSPGEIGWFLNDNLITSMQTFVPDAPLNTPSEPIHDGQIYTDGGYWLVKLAGVDPERAVSIEDLQAFGYAAYGDWVTEVSAADQHEIVNNWAAVSDWVIKQVKAEVS